MILAGESTTLFLLARLFSPSVRSEAAGGCEPGRRARCGWAGGNPMRRALTIAGSDSGGGAGIQADLKTFAALGVFGASAITSVTAQNTVGVQGVYDLPPEFVALQIDSVVRDIGVDAAKTGMLSGSAIIEIVASKIREYKMPNLVIDPVMYAKSGDLLLKPDARDTLINKLLPLSTLITPNIPEAEFI